MNTQTAANTPDQRGKRHVHHPKAHRSPRACSRGLGAAVALPFPRCDGAGRYGAREYRRGSEDRGWDSSTFRTARSWRTGRPRRAAPTSRSARFSSRCSRSATHLTVVSNIGNKPGESRAVHALVPGTWLSCVHPKETLLAEHGADGGSDRRSATRSGHRRGRHSKWRLRRATGREAPASAVMAAHIAARCRSGMRRTPLPIESNPRSLFLSAVRSGRYGARAAVPRAARRTACST